MVKTNAFEFEALVCESTIEQLHNKMTQSMAEKKNDRKKSTEPISMLQSYIVRNNIVRIFLNSF